MITVTMEDNDWIWMCSFLMNVIKEEDELEQYEREDLARLYNVLSAAERGV